MLKAVATVCAALLVLTYFCEQCFSLEIKFEHVENNNLRDDEELLPPETINYVGKIYEEPITEVPKQPEDDLFKLLFGKNLYRGDIENNEIEDGSNNDGVEDEEVTVKKRVVRQAYSGQAPLYPKLPSNQPYNQPYPNYNNQNPQWQTPNNHSQQGYPAYGVSNYSPTPQQNLSNGHNPYNPSQSQNPYYNNYPAPPSYPGNRPPNSTVYNSGQGRPPYNQHGQFNNNTYTGYPPKTPGNTMNAYNHSQRPPYSATTPSNRYPVTFVNTASNIPQYNNNYNTSNRFGNSGPISQPPYAPNAPNAPNGQNPQNFNSYPNYPYGQPNSTFPHNAPNHGPYNNPSNGGQYPANNHSNTNAGPYGQNFNPQSFNSYPQGQSQSPYNNPSSNGQYPGSNNPYGSIALNLPNGYNPSIPNRPVSSSGPGQGYYRYPPGSNGTAHDPTRVSPEYFSYPHQ